jgi:hypothetical protein
MEQLDRPVAVDGELALGPAGWSGPGREDDGIGAADRAGQLVVADTLRVAEDGLAAIGAEVVDVNRIGDHAADAVAPRHEQAGEPPSDLAASTRVPRRRPDEALSRRFFTASCTSSARRAAVRHIYGGEDGIEAALAKALGRTRTNAGAPDVATTT